jgi:hypothetical protein
MQKKKIKILALQPGPLIENYKSLSEQLFNRSKSIHLTYAFQNPTYIIK